MGREKNWKEIQRRWSLTAAHGLTDRMTKSELSGVNKFLLSVNPLCVSADYLIVLKRMVKKRLKEPAKKGGK